MKSFKWLFSIIFFAAALAVASAPAAANGAPVKIFLNYLPELSNYGATSASGVAQVSIGEAWVDLEAEGLPQLAGVQYEAWLVTSDDQMISLGTFNSDADGRVDYFAEFDDIPVLDYRFFVISVESVPDTNPDQADPRRSIAGVFPNARLEIVSGTPTATLEPGVTATPGAPAGLPVTGNANASAVAAAIWLALGLSLVIVGLALKKHRFE